MSCSHTGLANMAAMHTTQAPMSTLLRIRRKAQAEDVACRFATRCCTRWIFAIFFCRVNWLNSESVCASIIRLFRFALVTRTMALSSDAMSSDCQNSTDGHDNQRHHRDDSQFVHFNAPYVQCPSSRFVPYLRSYTSSSFTDPEGSVADQAVPWCNAKNVSSSWRCSPNICRSCSRV